jgi:hypothetical protein
MPVYDAQTRSMVYALLDKVFALVGNRKVNWIQAGVKAGINMVF